MGTGVDEYFSIGSSAKIRLTDFVINVTHHQNNII